jgi:pentatricopeptide repeat protein
MINLHYTLVDMYEKLESIETSYNVFDKMPKPDIMSRKTMIMGDAWSGYLGEALRLFRKTPQRYVLLWMTMISAYVQNRIVEEVFKLFEEILQPNVVSCISCNLNNV